MDYNTTEHNSHDAKMATIAKYLQRGWATLPLHFITSAGVCSCVRGAECRSAGKHPVASEWQASGGLDIDGWTGALAVEPRLNVGIATGAPSGFWVLDYDPANLKIGEATADIVIRLRREGYLPHVRTGGDGEHWRFQMPTDFELTNRRGTLPAGLDVRGTGGQVVAPPSVSGKGAYVELADATPYEPPAWLLDMIRPAVREAPPAGWSPVSDDRLSPGSPTPDNDRGPRYARAAVSDMLGELRAAESNRNDLAWRAACRIIEFGNAGWLDDSNAASAEWFEATLAHPAGIAVPVSEALSIMSSATRHVGRRPAVLPAGGDPTAPAPLGPALPPWEPPPFPVSGNGAGMQPAISPNGATQIAIERPTLASPNGSPASITDTTIGSPTGYPTPDGGQGGGSPPTSDPWELAVTREMSRELVRAEAKRRIAAGSAVGIESLRGRLLDTAAMKARPRLVPIVEGLLYRGTVARINGAPGCGKSFISIDLAARVAAGMPWGGRASSPTGVAYVVAEGGGGVGRRIEAWEVSQGAPMRVLWWPESMQIGGPEWDAWADLLAEAGVGLVVLDTQARATVGRNEIDGQDMGEVLAACDALAHRLDGCVLLVHHTPVGGARARGHGGMTGGLQTEILVTKEGRSITVRPTKGKDDDDDVEPLLFDLVDVAAPEAPNGGRPRLASPDGPRSIGVVPVWRGEASVISGFAEPAYRAHARALWTAIEAEVNPGLGATEAEIRRLAAGLAGVAELSVKSGAQRKAINKAWNELIRLGLLARGFRERRFKVVVVQDQSVDGVLTPNRGPDGLPVAEGPAGFEVCGEGDAKAGT